MSQKNLELAARFCAQCMECGLETFAKVVCIVSNTPENCSAYKVYN